MVWKTHMYVTEDMSVSITSFHFHSITAYQRSLKFRQRSEKELLQLILIIMCNCLLWKHKNHETLKSFNYSGKNEGRESHFSSVQIKRLKSSKQDLVCQWSFVFVNISSTLACLADTEKRAILLRNISLWTLGPVFNFALGVNWDPRGKVAAPGQGWNLFLGV
jgi:hypothetical protein